MNISFFSQPLRPPVQLSIHTLIYMYFCLCVRVCLCLSVFCPFLESSVFNSNSYIITGTATNIYLSILPILLSFYISICMFLWSFSIPLINPSLSDMKRCFERLSVCLLFCLSVCLLFCLSVCLLFCLFVSLFSYLSVSFCRCTSDSFCLFLFLSVCFCLYLSVSICLCLSLSFYASLLKLCSNHSVKE